MRFILGVVLAAVAAFLWGYVFWTVSSYPKTVLKTLPNQDTLVPALQDAIPEDGAYLIPAAELTEDAMEKQKQGPLAMILFHKGGAPPMDKTMLNGFLHMLGSAFLLAIVVATASRRSFLGRFVLVLWIALFLSIWTQMSNNIWWHFPIKYACLQMTYHLSAVAIMGLVLAFFIRPPVDPSMD